MGERPQLTVSDAIAVFEVERRTLQRLLSSGQLEGAHKDSRGRWVIPVETLHVAGFTTRQTWKLDATTNATSRDKVAMLSRQQASHQEKDDAEQDDTRRDSNVTDMRHRVIASCNSKVN